MMKKIVFTFLLALQFCTNSALAMQLPQDLSKQIALVRMKNQTLNAAEAQSIVEKATPEECQKWLDEHKAACVRTVLIQNPKFNRARAEFMVENATPEECQHWLDEYQKEEQRAKDEYYAEKRNQRINMLVAGGAVALGISAYLIAPNAVSALAKYAVDIAVELATNPIIVNPHTVGGAALMLSLGR